MTTAAPLLALAEERRQQSEPTPEVSAPAAPAPAAPAPDATIVPPRAIAALTAPYPEHATGDAEVVVELLVGSDGAPSEVRALSGTPPFSDAAVAAAAGWRFEPATRGGAPVRARIRVQVRFSEPLPVPEPAAPAAPAASAAAPSSVPSAALPPPPPPPPTEVRVTGQRVEAPTRLTRAEVRQLPGAFGDPFRALEMLPGVTPIASGLPYFYVRGAPPGNVGYFFDGIAVPTLYHAAVGPAVIHPSFIGDVQLFSGAYPARYGRYAGGIVAGSAAEPAQRLRGEANIRLVDSGALIEAPFDGDRGDVMLAGRYSYTGALVSLLAPEIELGYWDYQGRARYRVDATDSISVFGFGSFDQLRAVNDFDVWETIYDVTFHRLDLRYDRSTARRSLRVATTLGLDQTVSEAGDRLLIRSRRAGVRMELTERLAPGFTLRAGSDATFARFDIDIDDDDDDDDDDDADNSPLPEPGLSEQEDFDDADDQAEFEALFSSRNDLVAGVWLDFVLGLGAGVTLTPGLRFDLYNSAGSVSMAPEPRVNVRFELSDEVALRHDLGIAHQAPSFAIPVPGFQATTEQGLQRALQSSSGLEMKLFDDISASVSVFQNVLFAGSDALGVSQLDKADASVDADSDRVTSHSYGLELYIRRSLTRRLGGFVSYTLSRSLRSLGRLEGPSSFDRTHVFNFALAYDLGRAWRAGTRLMMYTGIPAEVAYPRAAQNPPRSPPFYRIDWRLEKRWRLGETGFWALVFEVLNTTLHKEVLEFSCYAYGCNQEAIGPVTVPSIGLEMSY